MRAHQIMTRDVITATPDTSIVDAATMMLQHHVSGLPVVDADKKLVGIVSEGDFLRRAEIGTGRKRSRWLQFFAGPGRAGADFVHEQGRKVGEVMSRNPITVSEDATLEDIVGLMEQNNVKRLPVMRGDVPSRRSARPIGGRSDSMSRCETASSICMASSSTIARARPPRSPLKTSRVCGRCTIICAGLMVIRVSMWSRTKTGKRRARALSSESLPRT
jgi:CBS domain-containing protein